MFSVRSSGYSAQMALVFAFAVGGICVSLFALFFIDMSTMIGLAVGIMIIGDAIGLFLLAVFKPAVLIRAAARRDKSEYRGLVRRD